MSRLMSDHPADQFVAATAVALLLLALVAMLPLAGTVEEPGVIVGAGELVVVSGAGAVEAAPPSGSYLLPRATTTTTFKARVAAVLARRSSPGPAAPHSADVGIRLLEVALLTGRGVAPGRRDPAVLGLAARMRSDHVPTDRLALLLHVADRANPRDLADGRRILALGAVDADGRVRCSSDPQVSMAATRPPPDLILIGRGCAPFDGWTSGIPVIVVGTFAEAFAALGS